MKYKLLVLDVDGTLTNDQKEITPRTRNALLKVQQMGVQIVLASGRPTQGIVPLAKALELHHYGGYVMAFNGGRIENCKTGEIMFRKKLDKQLLPYLYREGKRNNFSIVSYDAHSILTENPDDKYAVMEATINKMPLRQVDNLLEAVDYEPYKFMYGGDPEAILETEARFQKHLAGVMEVYRSEPFYLELVPLHVDKGNALNILLEKIGVKAEEMIVIGDGFADLTMMEVAGKGIAMANAQESIKLCADDVTASNNDDGVAQAVEKYILSPIRTSKIPLDQLNARTRHALMGNLGIQYTYVSEDRVEATMPVDERTRQPFGILHGGATLALGETVAGLGSMVLCAADELVVGMQVSGNHVSSAHEGDTVRAVGTIIHKGHTSHVWNVDVFTSTGKLVSTIRVINSILKKR